MRNNEQGRKELIKGLNHLIYGWKLLGLDKDSPDEFKKMKDNLKQLEEQDGRR